MREGGVIPIFWPPFSPDLSPIEGCWNKVYRNSKRLKEAVLEAWDLIIDIEIRHIIYTMH